MSAATPAPSTPGPEAASPAAASVTQDQNASATAIDKQVLEYLRSRGHKAAEQALLETLEQGGTPDPNGAGPSTSASATISSEDLIKKLAVYTQSTAKSGENALKDATKVLSEMVSMGNSVNIQNIVSSIGDVGAEDILSLDPNDKQEGYRDLESWVEGSLDMYRVRISIHSQFSIHLLSASLNSVRFYSLSLSTSTLTLYNTVSKKLVCTVSFYAHYC